MTDAILLCVPFAGAGASFFAPWRGRNHRIEVRALQLPGREDRVDEEPCTTSRVAVEDLVRNLPPAIVDGRSEAKVAVFGHSLGAVLAFELARYLEGYSGLPLDHVFISGSPGPWSMRADQATGLTDASFLARIREFAGYEHPALADDELRDLILPTLRADVQMHESYRADPEARVAAPITVLRGSDDALVSEEAAAGWRRATSAEFRLVNLPGGHMYLTDESDAILRLIADAMLELATAPGIAP